MNYLQVYMSQRYHRPIPDRVEGESGELYIFNECHSSFALLATKSLMLQNKTGAPKYDKRQPRNSLLRFLHIFLFV
jgi:hypothetical protein